MTESDGVAKDMFHRQALLGGSKVPVLWSMASDALQRLSVEVDADVGYPGNGRGVLPKGETLEEIEKMPWAVQYVECANELHSICRENEYKGRCWIERDDFTPWIEQNKEPGGRASWHPGNRIHQVTGRILAFTILQALKEALNIWNDAEGYELADDVWHVTEKYDAIRSKLETLDPEIGECHKLDNKQIGRVCNTPMKVRDDCRVFRAAFGYVHAHIFFFVVGSFGVHSSRVRWAHKYSNFDASCNEELYPETETMERLPATGCL